jgi:hypothetical protein
MPRNWRVGIVALGLLIALTAGCKKSGSTPGGSDGPGAPAKEGGGESYSKKLVGVWEGTEDFGGKAETLTFEFKGDGGLSIATGPFKMTGTWKLVKEEGKTLTLKTQATPAGFEDPKGKEKQDEKSFSIVFQDPDTIVMSNLEGKREAKPLKRKK